MKPGEKPNYWDGFWFPTLTGMVSDPTALESRSNTINRTLFICSPSSTLLEKAIPSRRALSRCNGDRAERPRTSRFVRSPGSRLSRAAVVQYTDPPGELGRRLWRRSAPQNVPRAGLLDRATECRATRFRWRRTRSKWPHQSLVWSGYPADPARHNSQSWPGYAPLFACTRCEVCGTCRPGFASE